MSEVDVKKSIDARGSFCPGPLMELIKAVKHAQVGDVIEVLSSDTGSAKDIPEWVKKMGHELGLLPRRPVIIGKSPFAKRGERRSDKEGGTFMTQRVVVLGGGRRHHGRQPAGPSPDGSDPVQGSGNPVNRQHGEATYRRDTCISPSTKKPRNILSGRKGI